MEKCQIHLFTSNHLEGWGAVVNEAMNSGCAVVASGEAGAVPFLIENGKNGLIYYKGSYEEFAGLVKGLVSDRERMEALGKAAYDTITGMWNAEHAAEGPLSEAVILSPKRAAVCFLPRQGV